MGLSSHISKMKCFFVESMSSKANFTIQSRLALRNGNKVVNIKTSVNIIFWLTLFHFTSLIYILLSLRFSRWEQKEIPLWWNRNRKDLLVRLEDRSVTFTSKNSRGKTATKVMIPLKAQFYKRRIGESHSRQILPITHLNPLWLC